MAEDKSQERTEQATPKRLQESKEKGQIARSRELSTMLVLVAASVVFMILGKSIIIGLGNVMHHGFSINRANIIDDSYLTISFMDQLTNALLVISPLLLIIFAVAVFSPLTVGGWIFSIQSISLKFDKINPIKGIERILSVRSLIELVKAILKFLVVLVVSSFIIWGNIDNFFSLGTQSAISALNNMGGLLTLSFLLISSSMILIALIDVPFQIWDHGRKLKMTRQEVKDEFKQTDGNPELKRFIKERQRALATKRMMDEVPKADVIITNPTHYSVALKYDQNSMAAPILVAKGKGFIAQQIRNIGSANSVPIVSAPPLSRALFYSTELNQPIPSGLFIAVAQVLAYVYRLKKGITTDMNANFKDLEIPQEYEHE